jgi:molybdopterin molybdotransferase
VNSFITVSFKEAIERSLQLAKKSLTVEWVYLDSALGRVLADDVMCQKNLPAFNNAALDGFGIRHSDKGKTLKIKQSIYAGMSVEACLKENECYKIMTGAKAPLDIDTIVPFEDALSYDESSVTLPNEVKKGNALRFKGEEQIVGSKFLEEGEMITPQIISVLASQGISKIPVYKKISIAVFSTGDELKEPWEPTSEDEIYNINSSSLIALLQDHGFEADYCGVIPDNLEMTKKYFSQMKRYDVLITSGGISMGEADFVEEALKDNGLEVAFHGIKIKPGKPTMMGKMGETLICSMPGNPLAAFVNAYLFLIPALKKLQGVKNFNHKKILCTNTIPFSMKTGRTNIILGRTVDGTFSVAHKNKYVSGMVTPLIHSNSIVVTDEETDMIKEGDLIHVYLIN